MIIEIAPKAKKQMVKLPKIVDLAVISKIRGLAENQLNLQIKKLQKRKDMYRVRVGDYRIIYQNSNNVIEVIAVQHRKDVYREL